MPKANSLVLANHLKLQSNEFKQCSISQQSGKIYIIHPWEKIFFFCAVALCTSASVLQSVKGFFIIIIFFF